MKTIRRNTKRAKRIFELATSCRVCDLDNCFHPESLPLPIDWLWERYQKFNYSRLRENSAGHFTLRFHSNLWYYIESTG